jgi:hypothetical protein
MRSFGTHLVTLLAGLAAGVTLAVLGFAPEVRTENPSARSRDALRPPLERSPLARGTQRADAPAEDPASSDELMRADRTSIASVRGDSTATPSSTLGELHGRLRRAAGDEAAQVGVVLARVRAFESSDPDRIARTTDFISSNRRTPARSAMVDGDRFGFFDLESGRYWLVVALAGRRVADRPVEIHSGESVDLDVDVPAIAPELRVRVHVTDERGVPLDAVTFSIATDVETALGSLRTESPSYPQRLRDGHYRLLIPWLAADVRVGRLAGRCTLKVVHFGFMSAEIPLGESTREEIEVGLARGVDVESHRFLVHVERADGGHDAEFAGVSLMGPMETPDHPKAHEMGWWADADAEGDAHFEALFTGRYRCELFARSSDGEARVRVLETEADVGPAHPRLDLKLPALHRVVVVAPASLVAIRPELLDPGAATRPSIEFGDGSDETVFPLVPTGPHDICFGCLRMRIDVRDDVRIDFVAESPREPPSQPARDGR